MTLVPLTDGQIVDKAAAWLDIRHPGWANKIDLDTFNIRCGQRCVGGQIGVSWYALTDQLIADHPGRYADDLNNAFATGQADWINAIRARQQTRTLVTA